MKRQKHFADKNRVGKSLLVFLFCFFAVFANQKKISAQEIRLTYNEVNYAEVIQKIETELKSGDTEQIRDALTRIRNLNTPETARLAIDYLRDDREIVRATAPFSILALPADEAAGLLLPQLADKSEFVRRETAYALGKTGSSLAVNPLIRDLQKDKITEVRAASAVALGEIGDAAAVGDLDKILQRKRDVKEDFLRRAAARSIGQIAQIIQTNVERVITPDNLQPEIFKDLRKPKFLYLGEQFPIFNESLLILTKVLQSEKEAADTQREAAFSLGAIGDLRAAAVLRSKLNSDDYYLTQIIQESLREIEYLEFLRRLEKEEKEK